MLTVVRIKPAPARLALAVAAASLAPIAQADFIEDSSATLQTQNIYLNRDFREGSGQSKREEWAQGFLLNIESGFTEGTVGFGLDAMGMLGVKLDSGGPNGVESDLEGVRTAAKSVGKSRGARRARRQRGAPEDGSVHDDSERGLGLGGLSDFILWWCCNACTLPWS